VLSTLVALVVTGGIVQLLAKSDCEKME
jgi:hypothetical protein